jgi:hypothetical protein
MLTGRGFVPADLALGEQDRRLDRNWSENADR